MNELKLQQVNTITPEGIPVQIVYDQEADILEIFFGANEPATGVELTDYILLRFNRQSHRAISLTLRHFSILAERTEYGPRSYALDRLAAVPENLREQVLRIITTQPVNQFLRLSYFQASPTERIPFTYVESQTALAV